MAGEPGNSVFETDAKGKFVKQVSFYKGLNGKNIITTLDSDIQVAAYEAIKNESGSVIVMDNFGEIITMVSSPLLTQIHLLTEFLKQNINLI